MWGVQLLKTSDRQHFENISNCHQENWSLMPNYHRKLSKSASPRPLLMANFGVGGGSSRLSEDLFENLRLK
jgi:hypothetical protein